MRPGCRSADKDEPETKIEQIGARQGAPDDGPKAPKG
jgi:hypothetical protein